MVALISRPAPAFRPDLPAFIPGGGPAGWGWAQGAFTDARGAVRFVWVQIDPAGRHSTLYRSARPFARARPEDGAEFREGMPYGPLRSGPTARMAVLTPPLPAPARDHNEQGRRLDVTA